MKKIVLRVVSLVALVGVKAGLFVGNNIVFLSSSDEEIVRSSIIDCMINRIEVKNGGEVGVLFSVIRTGVLEQIEKTTDDSSISSILGSPVRLS